MYASSLYTNKHGGTHERQSPKGLDQQTAKDHASKENISLDGLRAKHE
jgi:hypothetical protein